MKFKPTIDAFKTDVIEAILDGSLKLQRGQWVRCNRNDKPSRFVGITSSGSIWAVHPNWNKTVTNQKFQNMCKNFTAHQGG